MPLFRAWARQRGLAVGVIVMLAAGIAALTTAFAVVHAALYRQPPFPEASRLAILSIERNPAGFVHAQQITAGIAMIQALGAGRGFVVDQTADATQFHAANLAQYAVVVFLSALRASAGHTEEL